jgi:MFS family permease
MASALGVGVAEGTIMSAWTAIVRKSFGARRFGMNLAIYNSAIALGSAVFNGLAAAAVAAAVARGGGDEDGDGAGGAGEGYEGDSGAAAGYRAVFAVSSAACAGAAGLGVLLTRMLGRENQRRQYE